MNNTPPTLYKYVSPNRISVLENLEIRFTQPSALNDPFEFNLLFTESVSPEELRRQFMATDLDKMAQETIKNLSPPQKAIAALLLPETFAEEIKKTVANMFLSSQLEAFHETFVRPHTEAFKSEIWNSLNRTIGILSLSSDCTSAPMWASYADNSKGIILGFDTSSPFFNRQRSEKDEMYHLREVVYEDRLPGGTLSETNPDILIRKSKSWEYENEWRMLAPLEKADTSFITPTGDEVFLFAFPPTAVSQVILGLNTDTETTSKVQEILSRNSDLSHITIKKIKKGPSGFEVTPLQ